MWVAIMLETVVADVRPSAWNAYPSQFLSLVHIYIAYDIRMGLLHVGTARQSLRV